MIPNYIEAALLCQALVREQNLIGTSSGHNTFPSAETLWVLNKRIK